MSFEDDLFSWDDAHIPELVQCEVPRSSDLGVAQFLETWLQQSSVSQNVRALNEAQTQETTKSTLASADLPQASNPSENSGAQDPPPPTPKPKGRGRKANFGGEKSAKKSAILPVPTTSPVTAAPSLGPASSPSGPIPSPAAVANSSDISTLSWNPSDEQINSLLQKVLVLELQQAGFDSSESQALEVFSDIAVRYISKLARNLRLMLDRYSPLSVETKPLWNAWLRSMHISLTELPLYVHHDVTSVRQRLAAASSATAKLPHEHVPLAALIHENKPILEAFQQDQPLRLSRHRMQPSPPRDYSAYFDPNSVEANASNFQYSIDSFTPHLASLPQNLDPTDPAYAYPAPYPYYGGSSPSFEPDKPHFYSYVQPNTVPAGSSSVPTFPVQHDSRV